MLVTLGSKLIAGFILFYYYFLGAENKAGIGINTNQFYFNLNRLTCIESVNSICLVLLHLVPSKDKENIAGMVPALGDIIF